MRKIALLTENSREYGRELLKGVAMFAQERRSWVLRLLTPDESPNDAVDVPVSN